jgi:hypothetical protein
MSNLVSKIIPQYSPLYRMLALTGLYLTIRTRLKKRDLLVFDVLLCGHLTNEEVYKRIADKNIKGTSKN